MIALSVSFSLPMQINRVLWFLFHVSELKQNYLVNVTWVDMSIPSALEII